MRKLLLTIALAASIIIIGNAQDYNTGIGLRGGVYNGITAKHFLNRKAAVEGLLSTRWSGFEITGLYEIHDRAFDVDRLNWYYGAGAHIGFYNGDYAPWGDAGRSYTTIGIDGILGIEYNLTEIPVNISLDWKPSIDLAGYSHFWGEGAAISIRYIF